jgi:tetratricopeptide (TPR) repeat protein
MQVVRLSDLDPVPVLDGQLSWLPVRRALGVTGFGINAYRGAEAGDLVVEEHDEAGLGHEELYLVVTGRAAFEIAGERVDVPAGSMVFLPEPGDRRVAHAEEAGTTVLAVGGPPGEPYTPSAWEWYFLANEAYRRGDYDEAYAIAAPGLDEHPDNAGLLYNLACFLALAGREDEALELAHRAFQIDPATRGWADGDRDLDAIRSRL